MLNSLLDCYTLIGFSYTLEASCNAGFVSNQLNCLFEGFFEIFNLDIDECANNTDNCDVNAYCNNTVGSYNCTCHAGYTGNGTTCIGV